MKKRIAILGSTGSIGNQTLQIAREHPDKIDVIALAAGKNVELFERQVEEFSPVLRTVAGNGPSLEEISSHPEVDIVLVATSGAAGLAPTLEAIRSSKTVALANKEVLVMAGEIVMSEARKHGVDIKPVDSEHSAIWQCLQGEPSGAIQQIILTASGGAFRDRAVQELASVTAEEALRHPTWTMGKKVTIDSANLMNKGFEVIEAHWLFNVSFDRIKVMIHPGSFIHSMIEFGDGSVKAQLGVPDMRLPIQYAISHPDRWASQDLPKLDFDQTGTFDLYPIDLERYPCLRLAFEAGRAGGTLPAVLSVADEIAVDRFLRGNIGFLDVPQLLEDMLNKHDRIENPSIDDIWAVDNWTREMAQRWEAS